MRGRAWLVNLIWIAVPVAAFIILLCVSQTAREVTAQTAFTLVQFLSTPFILETCFTVIGLCIVFAWNQWRRDKHDHDEWVYLEKTDASSASTASETPPHRLDAVVWKERPEPFDGAAAALTVIEGYLALGLSAEAEAAFEETLRDEPGHDRDKARAAIAIAGWHLQNSSREKADSWLRRAITLDVSCRDALEAGHPLRALAGN